MTERDDFAAFMEGQGPVVVERLARGQKVTGTVSHISSDSVFVALGSRADGRIPRVELSGRDGQLRVAVGDTITATVVDPGSGESPLLAVTLGKDQSVDVESLLLAMESGTPVHGRFTKAVKGGLEVDLNGVRAFCPASQVDVTYVGDLTTFVDQETRVAIIEVKEDGRSVVVSRRRVLELERKDKAAAARARLSIGLEVTGRVSSVQPYGAFVDLDGVEGLVHISELSGSRVDNVGDVVSIGEEVTVKVLAIEETEKGPRIRLSMKALQPAADAVAPPKAGQVLTGKVLRFLPHGVIVGTEGGEGFVHKNELGLPHGSDHRRVIAVDQEIEVTMIDSSPGRLRFSASRVDDVRAEQDFAAYRKNQADGEGGGLGSLAGQLQKLSLGKLPPGPPPPQRTPNLPAAEPAPVAALPASPPAAPVQPADSGGESAPATPSSPPGKRRRIVR